jgi:hypothetical protein
MFVYKVAERPVTHTQKRGRPPQNAARGLQCLNDVFPGQLIQILGQLEPRLQATRISLRAWGERISCGRQAAVIVSRSSMATTRSITFSSSRMLPGQG